MRHPAGGDGRGEPDPDGAPGARRRGDAPRARAPGRRPHPRPAARARRARWAASTCSSTTCCATGPQRWLYGATMVACLLAAVPLVVRQRVSRWHTFGLVLLGDLIYLVVVFCIDDPVRYATPLMLLFPSFVAAWFLGRFELARQHGRHVRRLPGRAVAQLRQRRRPRRPGRGQRRHAERRGARGLPAAPAGAAAARRHPDAAACSTRSPGCSTAATSSSRHPACGARPAATAPGWRPWCSTSTTSSGSTTPTGTPPATPSCGPSPPSLTASVRPTDVLARTGGEELVVLGPGRRPRRGGAGWPSACAAPSPTPARPTGTR